MLTANASSRASADRAVQQLLSPSALANGEDVISSEAAVEFWCVDGLRFRCAMEEGRAHVTEVLVSSNG